MFRDFLSKIYPHKKVIQNFGYLSVLQIFNLALPLITYPYLIRTLGKEVYGLIIYAQALVGYLVLLVSYGFNISGVREISINRGNKSKINEVFSSIMIIKTLLLVLSFIIMYILLYFIPIARGYENLFYLTMWLCIYEVIFPVWYFQGVEDMKYITIISFIGRLVFLALIFLIITEKEDFLYVPLLNGVGAIIAGSISLCLIFFKDRVKLILPRFSILKFHLNSSFSLFLSIISIKIYSLTNRVILGSFIGMTEVSYYDLADKIVNILKSPSHILSQSIFPRISRGREVSFVKRIFKLSLLFNVFLFLILALTASYLIEFLGGKEMQDALNVTILMGLLIPLAGVNNIFGVQILVGFGYQEKFSRIMMFSALFYTILLSCGYLFSSISLIFLVVVTILTEFFVSLFMFWEIKRLKIISFSLNRNS